MHELNTMAVDARLLVDQQVVDQNKEDVDAMDEYMAAVEEYNDADADIM
jgi:hypothetical protein